ncbi:MAG TPA: ABC transporter substrate-binding protein [Stellaceae bacterium]|nr:ABC transporter substrate-binding protein [Stellaceae bacterium]
MKVLVNVRSASIAAALIVTGSAAAHAQGTIKIGVIDQFSGQFADFGEEIGNGIDTYMREHGDTVAGKKIEILRRDQSGPDAERGKQVAQELIVRDKVDFLAGIDFSPTAFAIAPLITQAKKPTVIMNAATMSITDSSPYFVRFASTLEALETVFAKWVAQNGTKSVYVVVSDYVAGHAAGDAFKKAFTAAGGTITGETGVPLTGLDLAPYVQRIADQKPAAVFLFLASTKQSEEFAKLYVQTGLKAAGTKLLGATDLFQQAPAAARATSDAEIGAYTVQNYAWTLDTPLNKTYVADYTKYFGTEIHPDFMSSSAYAGMDGIYRVIAALDGKIDGDKAMAAFKTLSFDTPRGHISIDPATRDVVQPIYIFQIERDPASGELVNKKIFTFENVYNHLDK